MYQSRLNKFEKKNNKSQKKKYLFAVLAVLALSIIGLNAIVATGGNHDSDRESFAVDCPMHDFNSGEEFGIHISMHDEMFMQGMNPGMHNVS